jgi:hypothetical protein
MGRFALSVTISVGLFLGIFVMWEIGRRVALYRRDLGAERTGIGAVEGAVFGLMGLMLAFSFSGAMSRWDTRRDQVVEEANRIGTAWLRLDLLPADRQPALRELFRRYLDLRLAAYQGLSHTEVSFEEIARANALQLEIWKSAVGACLVPEGERARILLLPALNDMIDITTTRTMATQTHPPAIITVLLLGLVLASSLLAGAAMAHPHSRGWVHMTCFALVMSISVYMIMDLEYPRLGLIRIDAVDEVLVGLRSSMN